MRVIQGVVYGKRNRSSKNRRFSTGTYELNPGCDRRRIFVVVGLLRSRFSGHPTAVRRTSIDVIPDKRIADAVERAWRRSCRNLARSKILIKVYYACMATADHSSIVDNPRGYRSIENHHHCHKTFPCLSVVKNRVFFYILYVFGYNLHSDGRFLYVSLTDTRFTNRPSALQARPNRSVDACDIISE